MKILHNLAQAVACIALLAACATTKHANTPVTELTDVQLVEELASVGHQLGVKVDAASYLLAIRPEPAYVLASSTSFTHGTYSGTSVYTMPSGYSRNIYGSHTGTFSGTTTTNYQYYDANATARAANNLAIAINQAQIQANIERGKEVIVELQRRQRERQAETQAVIEKFFNDYPEMRDEQPLLAAILPWVSAENPEKAPYDKLEEARNIALSNPREEGLTGRWFGVFSQQIKDNSGEQYNVNSFFVIGLGEADGKIAGKGVAGNGGRIELYGTRSGHKIEAVIVNKDAGVNSAMEATASPEQISGSYKGSGRGLTWRGDFAMYR